MTGDTASRWIPERIVTDANGRERCRWVDVAGLRFTDPFFDSTLVRRQRHAGTERWTSIDELHAAAAAAADPGDLVFIFHPSRCGSTLMAQLFGLDERTLVLSEAPLLDALLRSAMPHRDQLFVAALRLLGDPHAGEQRLVVKTDCWHLFHAKTLRRLYPHAAFVLLYRSPAAVLASHQRMRGMQVVPGVLKHAPFAVDYDAESMDLDRYAALVIERHYEAMLELATSDERSLLVSYEEGFPAAFSRVARWLGLSFSPDEMDRIRQRCDYHGKRPGEAFSGEARPIVGDVDLARLESLSDALDENRTSAQRPGSNQSREMPAAVIGANRSPAPMP